MRYSYRAFAAVAAGILPLASAQTSSTCNPMEKTCPADAALSSSPWSSDFTKSGLTGWNTTAGNVPTGSANGAEFVLAKRGDAPTIQSETYIFFGYVEVKMKAAPGTGIVSSIVLESDDLDEVDWEFLGGNNGQVQTNYFGKGNTTTYDRMIPYDVTDVQGTAHTYAVNWTSEKIDWIIDSNTVRTLNYADANGGSNFPQTPMNVRIGIWAGGDPSNGQGTIEWAGGETDYTKCPFNMYVESVSVTNYSPGSEYVYGDQSGSYQSIQVKAGTSGSNSGSDSSSSAASSAAPAASASASADAPTSTDATATKGSGSATATTGADASSTSAAGLGSIIISGLSGPGAAGNSTTLTATATGARNGSASNATSLSSLAALQTTNGASRSAAGLAAAVVLAFMVALL